MKSKILIKKEDFKESENEKIDFRKIKDLERVDITDSGVEISFIIEDGK